MNGTERFLAFLASFSAQEAQHGLMGRVESFLITVPSIPIHCARQNWRRAEHLRGGKVIAVRDVGSIEFGHQRSESTEAVIGHGPSIALPENVRSRILGLYWRAREGSGVYLQPSAFRS